MAKAIRDVYGETLKKYGAMNENIVVLDADVSGSQNRPCSERSIRTVSITAESVSMR